MTEQLTNAIRDVKEAMRELSSSMNNLNERIERAAEQQRERDDALAKAFGLLADANRVVAEAVIDDKKASGT